MIEHFYLLYHCLYKAITVKFKQPSSNAHNIASMLLGIAIMEWVIFIWYALERYWAIPFDMEDLGRWYFALLSGLVYIIFMVVKEFVLKSRLEKLKIKFEAVQDWNSSGYRMRGKIYMLFYYALFPWFFVAFFTIIPQ